MQLPKLELPPGLPFRDPSIKPSPPRPTAIVIASPGFVAHTVSAYPPPLPPVDDRTPAVDPPPPPPPPHICTRTQFTPAGAVHCVVHVVPDPQDHSDIVSPVTIVEPSNTAIFCVAPVPAAAVICVHRLSGLHKNRFSPLAASVLKNNSPVAHSAGIAVPIFAGLVVRALDASQSPFTVRLPITVLCPYTQPIAAAMTASTLNIF
jgi:hypothetical protein